MKNLKVLNKSNGLIYEVDVNGNDLWANLHKEFIFPNGYKDEAFEVKHKITEITERYPKTYKNESFHSMIFDYLPIDKLPFSFALHSLTNGVYSGIKIKLPSWGENEYVEYQDNDNFNNLNPYLRKQNEDMSHDIWTPSTKELLSDDWQIIL